MIKSTPQSKIFSGLVCGPKRSFDYKQGHTAAMRRTVIWLQERAASMNDPHARKILNSTVYDFESERKRAQARFEENARD